MCAAYRAIGKWLAGFDRYLPQIELAQGLHRWLDVVFFPHRDTAAGQNEVVLLAGTVERGNRCIKLVGHDAQVGHSTTEAQQQRA